MKTTGLCMRGAEAIAVWAAVFSMLMLSVSGLVEAAGKIRSQSLGSIDAPPPVRPRPPRSPSLPDLGGAPPPPGFRPPPPPPGSVTGVAPPSRGGAAGALPPPPVSTLRSSSFSSDAPLPPGAPPPARGASSSPVPIYSAPEAGIGARAPNQRPANSQYQQVPSGSSAQSSRLDTDPPSRAGASPPNNRSGQASSGSGRSLEGDYDSPSAQPGPNFRRADNSGSNLSPYSGPSVPPRAGAEFRPPPPSGDYRNIEAIREPRTNRFQSGPPGSSTGRRLEPLDTIYNEPPGRPAAARSAAQNASGRARAGRIAAGSVVAIGGTAIILGSVGGGIYAIYQQQAAQEATQQPSDRSDEPIMGILSTRDTESSQQ